MNIVWLTWKDRKNPRSGGAEVINEGIARRLVQEGNDVTFVVAGFSGGRREERVDGFRVIRLGNSLTVYLLAFFLYRRKLARWADFVIDEVNTIPFFAKYYCGKRNAMFFHQLCREIWLFQLPPWVGFLGYVVEPIYLRLLSDRYVITVSDSTKRDLMRYGYREERIFVISEAVDVGKVSPLDLSKKPLAPTLLSFGSIRPMKRTLDQIKAFEIAKSKLDSLRLIVAGDIKSKYAVKVLNYIRKSKYSKSITIMGQVSQHEKLCLMAAAHFVLVTSVKEGWCLVVTEANTQGTPAIVYDVDGLRDSVRHGVTGIITREQNPESLASSIIKGFAYPKDYKIMAEQCVDWSKELTFDNCFTSFKFALAAITRSK